MLIMRDIFKISRKKELVEMDHTLWDKFNELGIDLSSLTPEDVNWMSNEPSMKPFLDWFQEYVSCDNVLSYGELEEYQAICAAGEELHGEELDDALRRAGISFDDLPIDQSDIYEEREEISFLEDQLKTLSIVEKQLQTSLEQQEESDVSLCKKFRDEQMASVADGQALMKLSVHVKSSLTNFFQSLQQLSSVCLNYKDTSTIYFLAQAPLDEFLMQCDTFEQNMKMFIKKQFDHKELAGQPNMEKYLLMISDDFEENEGSSGSSTNTIQQGFKVHPETLWQAEVRRVCALAKLRGSEAALENVQSIRKQLNKPNSISSFRLDCAQWKNECSILETEIDIIRQHEVSTAAKNFVVAEIAVIAENFARGRSMRRRCRLDKLKSLHEHICQHVLLTDLLGMMLRREKKLVKVAALFIDEAVTFLNEEHTKHLNVMDLHQELHQSYESFLDNVSKGQTPLVAGLRRLMGVAETEDVASLINALQNLAKQVGEVDRTNFTEDVGVVNVSLEKSVKSLQENLFAGPTRQPLLIHADILKQIGFVENSLGELERDVDRLETNFSSEEALFNTFPHHRDGRLLWAWFLAAPEKLSVALKRLEEAVEKERK